MFRICAFDIETRNRNPEFVCGAVFSDEHVGYYAYPDEMIDAMRRHARKGYTMVAHHAEYDSAVLLWGQGEDVSLEYSNNLFSVGRWRYGAGNRSVPIWDSMRLCAGLSVESLGEAIGIPKYQMPHRLSDPDDVRQDWMCDRHDKAGCIECYVTRDAEIVWSYVNALREWIEPYGIRSRNSLARSAMDLWTVLDPNKQQSLRSREVSSLARAAHHGGRNEVFQYGTVGRTYTADIRSFYGSILRSILLPDMSRLRVADSNREICLPEAGDGVVEATVRIPDSFVPPLPVSFRDRVYYPVGRCHGFWPISELQEATRYGVEIDRIHKMVWSDTLIQPFATTAGTLLELRESLRNRSDARELVAKFMLNAIPGRLGMRDVAERTSYRRWRRGMTKADIDGADIETDGKVMYLARRHMLTQPSKTSNVLWAAIITGMARIRLNRYLRQAGTDLLYCDTDSVHSLSPLPIEGDAPGMLRDTGIYDSGLYLGAKFYSLEAYDGTVDARAKGVPRKHAVEFMQNRHIAYQTTLSVVEGILRGVQPCIWVDADRVARFAPGTRSIVEPGVLSGEVLHSTTAPVAFTIDDSTLTSMQTHDMI